MCASQIGFAFAYSQLAAKQLRRAARYNRVANGNCDVVPTNAGGRIEVLCGGPVGRVYRQ
jgi:hypothetical protein